MEASMKIAIILSAYDKMTGVINRAVSGAQGRLQDFSQKADRLADKSFNTGKQLVAAGLAVGAPLYTAIQRAQEFETKMIDIRKQMKFDTPEVVANMTKQVMQLGRELPLATGEIQDMIAAGLRMGIAEDKVVNFTREVTKMSVAFDMGAGDIADSMGKIANVFKIPIDKIGEFADAINYLDDNTMAKGAELIDVLQRMGGSAKNLKPTQAAALGATLLSLGESAETAGSGASALLNQLGAATMQSKRFQTGMQALGLSSAAVQKAMSNPLTAQGTILDVFERIQKLKPEQQTEMLVRLFGKDHGPRLMKLANNVAEYRRQLALVQGQEKGSMSAEYQKRIKSSAAQFQIMKNKVNELWVKVGNSLLPTFNKFIDWVGRMTDRVGKFVDKHPTLIANLGKAAALFSAIAIVGGYLSFVIGGVAKMFSILATAVRYAGLAFQFIKAVFAVLKVVMATNPIFLIAMALIAVVALVIANWSRVKSFFSGLFSFVKKLFFGWVGFIKNLLLNFTPAGLIFKNWGKITAFFSNLWQGAKNIFFDFVRWVFNLHKMFYNAGANIIKSIWGGIKAFINKPIDAIKNMVGKIRNLLPFSPAKDGPLRDIHRIRLVETIAETIKPKTMVDKMRAVAGAAFNVFARPQGPRAAIAAAGGAGGHNFTFNITLNGGASKADAALVTSEIKRQFSQLMQQYGNQQKRVSFG